jgi:hypothetical protein
LQTNDDKVPVAYSNRDKRTTTEKDPSEIDQLREKLASLQQEAKDAAEAHERELEAVRSNYIFDLKEAVDASIAIAVQAAISAYDDALPQIINEN